MLIRRYEVADRDTERRIHAEAVPGAPDVTPVELTLLDALIDDGDVADLLGRLAKDPGIAGASTFTSRAVAEAAISDVLGANASRIQSFLAGSGSRLSLSGRASGTIGRYVAASCPRP